MSWRMALVALAAGRYDRAQNAGQLIAQPACKHVDKVGSIAAAVLSSRSRSWLTIGRVAFMYRLGQAGADQRPGAAASMAGAIRAG
jgi:hypothetical protein